MIGQGHDLDQTRTGQRLRRKYIVYQLNMGRTLIGEGLYKNYTRGRRDTDKTGQRLDKDKNCKGAGQRLD